jgi:hypothetical protein
MHQFGCPEVLTIVTERLMTAELISVATVTCRVADDRRMRALEIRHVAFFRYEGCPGRPSESAGRERIDRCGKSRVRRALRCLGQRSGTAPLAASASG